MIVTHLKKTKQLAGLQCRDVRLWEPRPEAPQFDGHNNSRCIWQQPIAHAGAKELGAVPLGPR